MSIDLKKVTFETPIWYKGIECRIIHLARFTRSDTGSPQWTICLVDKEYCNSWFNSDFSFENGYVGTISKVYTGNVNWEGIEKDCHISNAIEFIRDDI